VGFCGLPERQEEGKQEEGGREGRKTGRAEAGKGEEECCMTRDVNP
jgi:hypothetical protein